MKPGGPLRVVVTGSECTGKSTLAAALATHYGGAPVPEFVRLFVARKGAPPDQGDVDAIARGQIGLEDKAADDADRSLRNPPGAPPPVIVGDTDLLSTIVYSRHYYGTCPEWIESAFRGRPADLYVLAGIDVPWEPDGDQRDRPDRREEMQTLFRRALQDHELRFIEVHGDQEKRLAAAIDAVDSLRARAGH